MTQKPPNTDTDTNADGHICTYAGWLRQVDGLLEDRYGFGHRDMPDALWADWFAYGLTPLEAFQEYCEENDDE